MIKKKDWHHILKRRFWKYINDLHSKYDNIQKSNDRVDFLNELYEKVSNGKYFPSNPQTNILASKGKGVLRIVPALTREDYSVYYFCLKSLEEEMAENKVDGTFGGFQMGNTLREKENQVIDTPSSMPNNPFNRLDWFKNWKEYQKLAYEVSKDENNYEYFLLLNIANFYDNINLEILDQYQKVIHF